MAYNVKSPDLIETWLRRKAAYAKQLKKHVLSDVLRVQPVY